MPRNRFGGKHAKKMGNKHVNAAQEGTTRLTLPEEDQCLGRVSKKCGDGRFFVDYFDGTEKLEGLARMPGSMRKMTRLVAEGTYVIFQSWGMNDRKGSILHVYSEHEVHTLTASGLLRPFEEEDRVDTSAPLRVEEATASDTNTDDIDIDAL